MLLIISRDFAIPSMSHFRVLVCLCGTGADAGENLN
jgi:hypothetical protein